MSETQTQSLTNGDPSSKFIEHVTSYPLIIDSITTFKSNSYGAKVIDISNKTYKKMVKPLVNTSYAQKSYGLVARYIQKADALASDGLTRVDQVFPIVKQDTKTFKRTVLNFAYAPFRVACAGRNQVLGTFGKEYKKCGGEGCVAGGKAVISTGIVVTTDTLAWLRSFLAQKSE